MEKLHDLNYIFPILIGAFWAIIMLQSGLDKIINYKGNVSWLKDHFSKTFLGPMVGLLVIILALFETVAGVCSIVGIFTYLIGGSTFWIAQGVILSAISLLMLIFGQRIAQDYEGAKTIAIYFCVVLLSAILIR